MRNAGSNLAIETVGLTKGFGDWPALRSLDLGVDWGELVALFGANGSGKTTLLRILSTQARADAGRVLIAGYDCRRQANAVRRRVGLVGHSGFLYEDLTAGKTWCSTGGCSGWRTWPNGWNRSWSGWGCNGGETAW